MKDKVKSLQKALETNCQKCNSCPGDEEHGCPFSEEINNNYTKQCNCCYDCRQECLMDI